MEVGILQLFLLLNIFAIGALSTAAAWYAIEHRQTQKNKGRQAAAGMHISADERQRLVKAAEENLQTVLRRSVAQMEHDLDSTGAQLNKLLNKLGADIVDDEMKLFRSKLAEIRSATEEAVGDASSDIAKEQAAVRAELQKQQLAIEKRLSEEQARREADLQQTIAGEKERLLAQIDTKLGDAVTSFLVDTLGHNVDLGAQNEYLLALLEEHKAELKQGVAE